MVDSMIVCLSNAYMVEKSITTCLPPPRTQTGGDILFLVLSLSVILVNAVTFASFSFPFKL